MEATCAACGRSFEAKRSTAKFCGVTCRSRVHRAGTAGTVVALPSPAQPRAQSSGLVGAIERELEAADRLDTVLGQQAVELAGRIVSPASSGASVATLSKELRAVMAAAMEGVEVAADPLDELQRRRDAKYSASTG